ncbi:MAG: dihydrolipoyl dehydrogenase [Bdellovibrionales bacterium]
MSYDVCVIGSGPGGYVAAIRASQHGLKTIVVERDALGGVCLNVGCIPSKAMITAAHFLHRIQYDGPEMGITTSSVKLDMPKLLSWKQSVCDRMSTGVEGLLKGNKAEVIRGEAQFVSKEELQVKTKEGTKSIRAKNFIVATGSRPVQIPGFEFDEKTVMSSTGALDLDQVPKKLVVIGGGYIGLEISGYLSQLGSEVTVVEAMSDLLVGVVDKDAVQVVARKLKKQGVQILTNAKAKSYKKTKAGVEVTIEVGGKTQTLEADKILVTVGRRPNSDQCNLKGIGLKINDKGFLETDAKRRTNIPGIYAIGDIVGNPMLAHKASYEGVLVADVIHGANRVFDAKTVPAVIFTDPEIASVGWSEEEAKAQGYKELKVGKFPFAANGRAVSMMSTDGFIKMVADAKTDVVLGVTIVGPEASNLISEAALAIEMGARLEDLALTIHPHPTLGEAMMEAAEATLGHAIHIIQRPLRTAAASPTAH